MRKVDDGEEKKEKEKEKKRKEKIMTFIVATNVIASRPPERRPTGTPNARANNLRTYKTWLQVHMTCEHSVNEQLDGNFVFPMRILMIFLGQ